MRQLNRLTLFYFIASLILYVLVNLFFSYMLKKEIVYAEILLSGVTISLLFALWSRALQALSFKPKLKFLESDENITPAFNNKIDKSFQVKDEDFSLEALKLKMENAKYITCFFDKEKRILKFRSRFGLHSNDIGGLVVYDKENRNINFSCFPFYGYTETAVKRTQKVMGEIEKLIQLA